MLNCIAEWIELFTKFKIFGLDKIKKWNIPKNSNIVVQIFFPGKCYEFSKMVYEQIRIGICCIGNAIIMQIIGYFNKIEYIHFLVVLILQ